MHVIMLGAILTLFTLVINTGCTVNNSPLSEGVRGRIFRPGAGLD